MLRVISGGLLGYALIGVLIAASDTVIARGDTRAGWGLILIGEVMGLASAIYLWHTAPHYYSFYLLSYVSAGRVDWSNPAGPAGAGRCRTTRWGAITLFT